MRRPLLVLRDGRDHGRRDVVKSHVLDSSDTVAVHDLDENRRETLRICTFPYRTFSMTAPSFIVMPMPALPACSILASTISMLRKSARVSEPNWIALDEREANVQRSTLTFSLTVRQPLARFEREGVVGALENTVIDVDVAASVQICAVFAVAAAVRIAVPETLDFHISQFEPVDAQKQQRAASAMA